MDFLQAVVLSIVEGFTEFLPISSTGHLILVSDLLNIQQTDFVKSFEVIIQLGAILAIVVLYFKTLVKDLEVWKRILVAFIPTAIVGLILYKVIKGYLIGNTTVTLLALFFGGIAIILLEFYYQKHDSKINDIHKLSYKNCLWIGVAQSLSVIPGVSRAAATIFGGLFTGLSRPAAVEFSFLLAVPTMFAATALDLIKNSFAFTSTEIQLLLIGFTGAFFTALIGVKFLVAFVQKNNFIPFGIYRILLALAFFLLVL